MSSTQRAKLGSTNVAEAISREPAAGCMSSIVTPAARSSPSRAQRRVPDQQGGGDGGQALAATGEAEPVGRGGADRDVDAVPLGDAALGLLAPRPEPRPVADQLAGDVAHLPAGVAHAAQGLGEQVVARGCRPTAAPTYRSCCRGRRAPAAESSASQIACSTTSPSEWPSRPSSSSGQSSPATRIERPGARRWTSVPMPMRWFTRTIMPGSRQPAMVTSQLTRCATMGR